MSDIKIHYPDLLIVDVKDIEIEPIVKELNLPINIYHTTINNLYLDLKTKSNPIVIVEGEKLKEILNLLSDPEKLSKEYLKYLILLVNDSFQYQTIFKKLPETEIFIANLFLDFEATKRIIKSLLKNIFYSLVHPEYEEEITKLYQTVAELKFENTRRILEVERYITDLEIKSLELESTNKKLEMEIKIREDYEKELFKLNSLLEDYAMKLNNLIKELKTFNYTVSHDLKAPLRGISSYLKELTKEHLRDINLNERAVFCINQIKNSAENMSKMIDDLLKYSKLEFETPSLIKCDLEEIINQILNEYSTIIKEKNAEFQINLELKEIVSWYRGLIQIFSNLIGNALKYSKPTEKPVINISSKQVDKNILIIVQDNGIGFDMIYAERIFQLFKRVNHIGVVEGTGVGLAIVSKIVEKLKGKVWAESETGKGSKFFVQLPLS